MCECLQLYVSGIMGTETCLPEGYLNHAIILVGYNIGPAGNYWLLKNRFAVIEWSNEAIQYRTKSHRFLEIAYTCCNVVYTHVVHTHVYASM